MNTPTGNDLQQNIKAIARAVSERMQDNPELISDACHVALKLELKPEYLTEFRRFIIDVYMSGWSAAAQIAVGTLATTYDA